MPPFEEYCEEIKKIWDSHWLTNAGVEHNELENKLAERLSISNVSLVTNGHHALEIAISALGLKGEIITTPFTFVSTTSSIARSGCTPVFCDIDPVTLTMDPNKIESLITDRTVAILPVHVYGNICDVEAIQKIADKHHLKVIYDAAHAFNESYKGTNVSNFGDIAIFSFHATKVFNTIEGGCLAYKDPSLRSLISQLRDFGITEDDKIINFASGNAKMNEFQAAMGLCNLRHLDSEIEKRRKVATRYFNLLTGIKGIRLFTKQPQVCYNYAYLPVEFENFKFSRDEAINLLKANGIFARKYFYPLTSSFKPFLNSTSYTTPFAKTISENILTLPLYADLSIEDVEHICSLIIG